MSNDWVIMQYLGKLHILGLGGSKSWHSKLLCRRRGANVEFNSWSHVNSHTLLTEQTLLLSLYCPLQWPQKKMAWLLRCPPSHLCHHALHALHALHDHPWWHGSEFYTTVRMLCESTWQAWQYWPLMKSGCSFCDSISEYSTMMTSKRLTQTW